MTDRKLGRNMDGNFAPGNSGKAVNERSKLTRIQRLILTHPMRCKAPRRAALI